MSAVFNDSGRWWARGSKVSAGTEVMGATADVPAPAQAAIDARLAREEFDNALAEWWEHTPREMGEKAEKLWHALFTLRSTIAGEESEPDEGEFISDAQEARIDAGDGDDAAI